MHKLTNRQDAAARLSGVLKDMGMDSSERAIVYEAADDMAYFAEQGARKRAPGGGRPPLYPDEVTRPRTIRLPPSLWGQVEAGAKAQGVTLSVYLRDIIRDRIEQERRADRDRPQGTPA